MKVDLCKEHKQEPYQSHYNPNNCVLCKALKRSKIAEKEVARLRNCIRRLWDNPVYTGEGFVEDIKTIFTLYDLTQDEADKEGMQ